MPKFCAKRFGRNVLGETFFFGTTFCIWGWVLGRVEGLGWAGLGWAGLGWAGLGLAWLGWAGLGWGWAGLGWAGLGWAGWAGGWAGLGCAGWLGWQLKIRR